MIERFAHSFSHLRIGWEIFGQGGRGFIATQGPDALDQFHLRFDFLQGAENALLQQPVFEGQRRAIGQQPETLALFRFKGLGMRPRHAQQSEQRRRLIQIHLGCAAGAQRQDPCIVPQKFLAALLLDFLLGAPVWASVKFVVVEGGAPPSFQSQLWSLAAQKKTFAVANNVYDSSGYYCLAPATKVPSKPVIDGDITGFNPALLKPDFLAAPQNDVNCFNAKTQRRAELSSRHCEGVGFAFLRRFSLLCSFALNSL